MKRKHVHHQAAEFVSVCFSFELSLWHGTLTAPAKRHAQFYMRKVLGGAKITAFPDPPLLALNAKLMQLLPASHALVTAMPQRAEKTPHCLCTSIVSIWNRFFAVHLNGIHFLPAAKRKRPRLPLHAVRLSWPRVFLWHVKRPNSLCLSLLRPDLLVISANVAMESFGFTKLL